MGVGALIQRFDKHAFYFPSTLLNVRSRLEPEGPLGCTEAFNESPVVSLPAPFHIFPSLSRALTKDLCCVLLKSCNSSPFLSETQSERGNLLSLVQSAFSEHCYWVLTCAVIFFLFEKKIVFIKNDVLLIKQF